MFSLQHPATVGAQVYFEQFIEDPSWEVESTMRTILVGPCGLQAIGFVTLAFILLFLWLFNFTSFF